MPKVNDILKTEDNWTKRVYARESKDSPQIPPDAPEATCFCLKGAIMRSCNCHATTNDSNFPQWATYFDICHKVNTYIIQNYKEPYPSMEDWNDAPERTFDEVKKLVEALDI